MTHTATKRIPRKHTVDMLNGKLLPNILLYALPLIGTGVLQILYNMADLIVVGRWAGGTCLAAVGSNGALVNLIINLFLGLSTGVSVVVSREYGAANKEGVEKAVHTSILLSVIAGFVAMGAGLIFAPQLLKLMNTTDDVLELATLYLRIYFLGMPACMIYNFGAAVLRSVGDTKHPLGILAFSGLINVLLNLVFVIVFHLDVAGVAIATTVSQIISAVLVIYVLLRTHDIYKFVPKKLRINKEMFLRIVHHGVPAGIQGSVFALSNLIIQSSINFFGTAAMAGNSAAANIEGVTYTVMNSMLHTSLAFISQNIGAKKPERIKPIFRTCITLAFVFGITLGWSSILLREPLLNIFTSTTIVDPTVTAEQILYYGTLRMSIIATTYFCCGVMDTLSGSIRGLGSPWLPMIITLTMVCGVRLVWIYTVFKFIDHSLITLYISYPVSWIATAAALYICYRITYKKVYARLKAEI